MIWLVALGLIGALVWWALGPTDPDSPRSSGPGPGAAGAIYDLLNEDRRKAIEIIVEQRAEARDPERATAPPVRKPEAESRKPESRKPRA